ncbi:hypothetical protein EV130_107300 [Rhizobium azibense]|uniref:Uncharacterized protein n=1 Tax=Rhizobium azibense TaxID=1136135 RepID=A0A4R3QP47_9HYPH|nr:hypothetical protein [Rhizobium azibense]TCU23940.1 hypothetical protein EV130_107300 [Rhizobium azibense]TCU36208.1 hypothetical protein EV129_108300 [Rhizobium azibense]
MEISSVRSSQSLLFKNSQNNTRSSKTEDLGIDAGAAVSAIFKVEDIGVEGPDFAAMSPSELRSHARHSYDNGGIDQDTFAAISEPLPMHAIDAQGNVIDLTGITDGTLFNFRDYYENQLQIAMSIGDSDSVKTLKSIVNFLNV